MKTSKITAEQYKEISEQSLAAREILEDDRFQFIRDYLSSAIEYAESSILNNTIREVQEVVPITEKLTRIFKTPKKVQVDELSGQYKFVKKLLDDLNYYASLQEELDREVSNKRVIVEGGLSAVGKEING